MCAKGPHHLPRYAGEEGDDYLERCHGLFAVKARLPWGLL